MIKKPIYITAFFLVSFITLNSCNNDTEMLFVQKIKGNKLLIVDYDVWFGRDGNRFGKTILSTTNGFDFRKINDLPISLIDKISQDKIEAISFLPSDSVESMELLKTKSIVIDGLTINFTFYKDYSSSGPCMLNEYKFNSFKETGDSIFLYGLDKTFGNTKIINDQIGFKKGNIKIHSDSLGYVTKLDVEELILIGSDCKSDSGKSKENSNYDNLRFACKRTYFMKPKSLINEKAFSDFGFFKEIK